MPPPSYILALLSHSPRICAAFGATFSDLALMSSNCSAFAAVLFASSVSGLLVFDVVESVLCPRPGFVICQAGDDRSVEWIVFRGARTLIKIESLQFSFDIHLSCHCTGEIILGCCMS